MRELSKVLRKLICMILVITFLWCVVTSSVSAKFGEESDFEQQTALGDVDTAVDNTAAIAITIARVVGATIAIVMLFVIAIKYMVSSAGDRADIKKHAVAYVVGAVILFGAVGILGAIQGIADNIGGK